VRSAEPEAAEPEATPPPPSPEKITNALLETGGDRTAAAKLLHLTNRHVLLRLMAKYGIDVPSARAQASRDAAHSDVDAAGVDGNAARIGVDVPRSSRGRSSLEG
jgi:hypothetical protein